MEAPYFECVCLKICMQMVAGNRASTGPIHGEIKDINGNPIKMTLSEHEAKRDTWASPSWRGVNVMRKRYPDQ